MPIDLAWDHNAWYHRRVLRALPARPDSVLDVGCGAGVLAARVAARARHVVAVDRAPGMVAKARAAVPANVTVLEADIATVPLPPERHDAVVSMSVLHHLDLVTVLPRLGATLRPGGVLVAIALPSTDLPRDLPVEVASVVGHRALGAGFRLAEAVTGRRPFAHAPDVTEMPMQDPTLTTAEVRALASRVLPGARVRRLPFWRYELRWRRPALTGPAG